MIGGGRTRRLPQRHQPEIIVAIANRLARPRAASRRHADCHNTEARQAHTNAIEMVIFAQRARI
jgi:hypothetical protein